jgi:predicted amidohydrolase
MDTFKTALLQLIPSKEPSENLEKGIKYCKAAKEMGADLALFPEMWNTGYSLLPWAEEDIKKLSENAIDSNSPFFKAFQNLAKELEMAIGITYLEKWAGFPRNTVSLIDYVGNCILTYAKIHTCDWGPEKYLTPGDDFHVTELHTKNGTVKIGAMICYDREFPESARVLMLKGAEIILVPNACPIEINRKAQLRTRAFENMVGIAMANYAYGKYECNGHSLAYDGAAVEVMCPGEQTTRDALIIEAGEVEGVYIAEFDVEKIREHRKNEIWGNAYRKPKKYSLLISEEITEPFIRNDRRE